jgi:tetratricopeptide (TPR) repeat protein
MKKTFLFLISIFTFLACSSSSDAWLVEAKTRLKKGELISAKEAIEKALEKNPGLAEAYNIKGVIAFQEKDFESAEKNYLKATELKPSLYEAQLNLASVRMETLQWKKALIPAEQAVKIAPDSSNGYLQRGIIWAALKNPDLAKQDFKTSISKNSKEIDAIYNLGNLYYQSNSLDSAIVQFEQAIKVNDAYSKAYYALGLSLYQQNNKEKACLSFQQAKKLQYPGANEAVKNLCQ